MKDAMDSIMELCEKGLNNGDYLIVSNNLKTIYDDLVKKQRYAIISNMCENDIIEYNFQMREKVSFILLEDEQLLLIKERERKEEKRRKENALYQLETMHKELSAISTEKRLRLLKYNLAKDADNFVKSKQFFIKYKEQIQIEKEYKQTVREFKINLKNTFP